MTNRRSITSTLLLLGLLPLAISCGSFKDEPQPEPTPTPAPQPPTPQPPVPQPPRPPVLPQPPQPPAPPQTETREQRMQRLCDSERQWAYSAGQIDSGQLQLFRRRNFAPIYNNPGVRQSGIESWVVCEQALLTNGFIEEVRPQNVSAAPQEETPPTPMRTVARSEEVAPQLPQVNRNDNPPPPIPTAEEVALRHYRMCDEERLYAYRMGYIDRQQLDFFRRRNFAPIYDIPGVRNSGVEAWVKCEDALELNGFIISSQPIL